MWNNDAIITSGGLRRNGHIGVQGLEYHMVQQIQDAARRWVGACTNWHLGVPRGWGGCRVQGLECYMIQQIQDAARKWVCGCLY